MTYFDKTNDMIEVIKGDVAIAYDAWKTELGQRVSKGGEANDAPTLFIQKIKTSLDFFRGEVGDDLGIPKNHAGWNAWRVRSKDKTVSIPRSVALAITELTNENITPNVNHDLRTEPQNLTDLINLGGCRFEYAEDKTFTVVADYVDFQVTQAKDFYREGMDYTTKYDAVRGDLPVGKVVYTAQSAKIFLSCDDQETGFKVARLSLKSDHEDGDVPTVQMSVDREKDASLTVQPRHPMKVMQGTFSEAYLFRSGCAASTGYTVKASVTFGDVDAEVEFAKDAFKGNPPRAKEKLIKHMFKNRWRPTENRNAQIVVSKVRVQH